ADHFHGVKEILDSAEIKYKINPRLVRGLDYYEKTVFEWITTQLGSQGTVCAGGRYDSLVEQHGSSPTPAIGFAMGLERLQELIDFSKIPDKQSPHVYLILSGKKATGRGVLLAEQLRDQLPNLRLLTHCGEGSMKSQFRKADKSGAQIALVLAEDEMTKNQVSIKFLRSESSQTSIKWSDIANFLLTKLIF
ncbi:MAG: histidine--tRNA ligase, partial [Legionellales bacterium]|nr:histidine--tRNA ligase [Legionellales bacterium]